MLTYVALCRPYSLNQKMSENQATLGVVQITPHLPMNILNHKVSNFMQLYGKRELKSTTLTIYSFPCPISHAQMEGRGQYCIFMTKYTTNIQKCYSQVLEQFIPKKTNNMGQKAHKLINQKDLEKQTSRFKLYTL